ncbi:hypothetical protein PPTG_21858 [Phytophthora nicotianae INRA-310]|uniref:Uncharacterized protein n=2 Tax=Phytophthora nicotianae TaxID=4792 RepID=W2QS91_PHYN3|nr:hypothetical protein PPTG_21858 [Phytophthora nicotianae INRA-310]ETN16072.1 hypothetical protein PPTG_21858 [Phytophthora nicotianae INRA-310]ETO60179.1 hypothetical protein F444_21590 [Phytophthora nicotianae P1976]
MTSMNERIVGRGCQASWLQDAARGVRQSTPDQVSANWVSWSEEGVAVTGVQLE